jgi:hypothetical protein
MYARIDWESTPIGRRIIERLAGGRARLSPAIVPEMVSWLRLIGNRYIALYTSLQQSRKAQGDAFLNAMRQTTETRIAMIQDQINTSMDQFSWRDYLSAWADTCKELGITDDDLNPETYLTQDTYEEGSGI